MEIPKRPLQNGDCIFFKSVRTGTKRNAATVNFKGHGFGLLLGHVPAFQPEPTSLHLIRILGTIGFISFDDIGEFVSAEVATEILKKFEAKYYGPQVDSLQATIENVLPGDNLDSPTPEGQPPQAGESVCKHGVLTSHVCLDCQEEHELPTQILGLDGNPIQ